MKFIWRIKNKEMLFGPRHQDARLRNFVSTLTQTQSAIFISSWKKLWPLQKCTDRTLCRVRYSSTSCIALINCQRDVNKKSMIENCELLVINIKYNLLVPLQCRPPYKHARVCYNKNRSWRDEILQYIDKNYAKCVRKVVELNWSAHFPSYNEQSMCIYNGIQEQKQRPVQCNHKVCVYIAGCTRLL